MTNPTRSPVVMLIVPRWFSVADGIAEMSRREVHETKLRSAWVF